MTDDGLPDPFVIEALIAAVYQKPFDERVFAIIRDNAIEPLRSRLAAMTQERDRLLKEQQTESDRIVERFEQRLSACFKGWGGDGYCGGEGEDSADPADLCVAMAAHVAVHFVDQRDRLAADVKRLEEERDAKQAQLVLEILDRQEFEGRWLQAAADVKKLRAAVQLALNAFEHNWCINWDDLARVLTETEATHTERGDAHEATRDGMRLHRVPSQGGYVATGDGASVQHASSSLSMDEAACRIRDYAEQIEASDRLRSMSLSVERTLELESQLAALREQLEWVSRWRQSPEGEAAVPIGRWPWQKIGIALSDTATAATARDAALREEGRRRAIAEIMHNPQTSPDSLAAMLVERGRREAVSEVQRIIATTVDIELADASTLRDRVRALLATPAPPEGKP